MVIMVLDYLFVVCAPFLRPLFCFWYFCVCWGTFPTISRGLRTFHLMVIYKTTAIAGTLGHRYGGKDNFVK